MCAMNREEFLASKDFLKLGQAVNHENWQVALMTVTRMQKNASEACPGLFDLKLSNIRQCILHHQKSQALDILALIVAIRAKELSQK